MFIKERILIERRWLEIKNEYVSRWQAGHKDIQRFLQPNRGFFEGQIPNYGKTLDQKTQLDGLPQRAVGVLASGMQKGMSDPSRPWIKIVLEDHLVKLSEAAIDWLDLATKKILQIFSKSNVYGVLYSQYEEIASFGTACAFVLEDFDTVVRCEDFTIGEYYLGIDSKGKPDTFGRFYWMQIGDLVQEFGLENVTPAVQARYKNGYVGEWIRVCHLVEPNSTRMADRSDFPNMPWRSVQWEYGSPTEMALRIGGYNEFPVVAPRWQQRTTTSIYGFGPGHKSLGDVKMLMKLQRDYLLALDKVIDPPVQQDASVQGESNTLPGGVTRMSASNQNAGVRPAYQIQPDLKSVSEKIAITQEAIRDTFFYNLFLMLDQTDGRMTATEVAERMQEKNVQLGNVLEHLHNELHIPLVSRTFNIALRTGAIPPPPPELQGQLLKIEFISLLDQAQKMIGTSAVQQVIAFVGQLTAVDPGAVDNVDFDETIRIYAEMMGIPPGIIRSADVMNAVRQQKAKQQAQQQALAALGPAAKTAKDLSQAKMGQNSALDALVGNPSGGTPVPAGK